MKKLILLVLTVFISFTTLAKSNDTYLTGYLIDKNPNFNGEQLDYYLNVGFDQLPTCPKIDIYGNDDGDIFTLNIVYMDSKPGYIHSVLFNKGEADLFPLKNPRLGDVETGSEVRIIYDIDDLKKSGAKYVSIYYDTISCHYGLKPM